MMRAQEKYFGKDPGNAKSYMLDDFPMIVMRGGQTSAGKAMLDVSGDIQADRSQHGEGP